MNETKVCKRCGIEKPATEEYFYCNKASQTFRSPCKACVAIRNDSKSEDGAMTYYMKNRASMLQKSNERYKIQKLASDGTFKSYYAVHKNHCLEYSKAYKKANRDKYNQMEHRRKALKNNLPVSLTPLQWATAKQTFNNKCCYCGKEKPLTQDHFVSVHKGGAYSVENIVPACKQCNCSKNNRLFSDWYPKQPFYSKRREQAIINYLTQDHRGEQITFPSTQEATT